MEPEGNGCGDPGQDFHKESGDSQRDAVSRQLPQVDADGAVKGLTHGHGLEDISDTLDTQMSKEEAHQRIDHFHGGLQQQNLP